MIAPLPDSGWLNALKLPTRILVGLFFFSLLVFFADYFALLNLSDIGGYARTLTLVGILLFGSLSAAGLGGIIYDTAMQRRKNSLLSARRRIREQEAKAKRHEYETRVLKRLDYLSKEEIQYAADCLRKNEQSFLTYVHSPPVANLMAKGLVASMGGTYHQDHYPFYFVDFVWAALLERKEEIVAKDDEHRRQEAAEIARTNRLLPP